MILVTIKNVANIFLKVILKVLQYLPQFVKWMFSLFVLVLIIAVCVTIVYFLMYRHPRVPQVYRSINFDPFLSKYSIDLVSTLIDLHGNIAVELKGDKLSSVGLSNHRGVLDSMSKMLILIDTIISSRGRAELEDDFMTYFRFGDALKYMDLISKNDLRENGERFKSNGDLDTDLIDNFIKTLVNPLQKIGDLAMKLSSEFMGREDSISMGSKNMFQLVLHVHRLRLYFSYFKDVMRLGQLRRNKITFGVWTVYFAPMVREWWKKRVPKAWKKFPDNFKSCFNSMVKWWENLGVMIGNITCYLAYNDPDEREKRCKAPENFTVSNNDKEHNDKEVTEGFYDFLNAILEFIQNFVPLAVAVGRFVVSFPNDPLGTIFGILTLLIGTSIAIMLTVAYTLIGMLMLAYFVIGWLSFVYAWVIAAGTTVIYIVVTLLASIIYFILFILDLITGGLIQNLMKCENLPTDWINVPNFSYGNLYRRSLVYLGLVMRPCASRFRPSVGMCIRKEHEIPDFCPQQQIQRSLDGGIGTKLSRGPSIYDKYRPLPGFSRMSPLKRVKTLIVAHGKKVAWQGNCSDSLSQYDYINKHICSNPRMAASSLRSVDTVLLRSACMEAYCSLSESKGTSFCLRLVGNMEVTTSDTSTDSNVIIKKVLIFVLILTLLMAVMIPYVLVTKEMVAETIGWVDSNLEN